MADLLDLRAHRFEALYALLTGIGRTTDPQNPPEPQGARRLCLALPNRA